MKKSISNLTESLAFHLEGLHTLEKQIEEKLSHKSSGQSDGTLPGEIARYARSSKYKRMKLKRVFGYLLVGPFGHGTVLATELVRALQKPDFSASIGDAGSLARTLDVLALVAYKHSCYEQAVLISERLQLETATTLLEEIKEMESASLAIFKTVAKTYSARLEKELQFA